MAESTGMFDLPKAWETREGDATGTPPDVRCVTSYPVRRNYNPGVVYPPDVSTLSGVIDIHCHAHPGQQDALALAKYASRSGMRGILFKTIAGKPNAAGAVKNLQQQVDQWAAETGASAVRCWSGHLLGAREAPVSAQEAEGAIRAGATGIWLPVFNHANTLNKVGGRPIWWNKDADPAEHTPPLDWETAKRYGYTLLEDDRGPLKKEVIDIVKAVVENGGALFFGHATHREIFLLAEEVARLGFRRAVVDHPYSPFINLSTPQMKDLAAAGVTLNFTFDEISPLLGVDPAKMFAAICDVGVQHVTLSSDAGEPLFPNSVEAMRLIRGYMEAFGLTESELHQVCSVNPARIVADGMA